jgi:hypothetical protein
MQPQAERISVADARQAVRAGALLVCAYDDDEKCAQHPIEGALTLSELERRAGALPKESEIVFYCA